MKQLEKKVSFYEGTPLLVSTHPIHEVREISTFGTWVNVFNCLVGISMLSLPFAMRECGLASIPLTILTAWYFSYTAVLLGRINRDGEYTSYIDLTEAMFPKAKILVSFIFATEIFIFEISLLLLMGQSLHNLWPSLTVPKWTLISLLAVSPQTLVQSYDKFEFMSVLNVLGVAAIVITQLVLTWLTPVDVIVNNLSSLPFITSPTRVAFLMGILAGCFSVHYIMPEMQQQMARRDRYNFLSYSNFFTSACVCILVMVAGVAAFGSDTASVLTINYSQWKIPSALGSALLVALPFLKFGINFNSLSNAIEELTLPRLAGVLKEKDVKKIIRLILLCLILGGCFVLQDFAIATSIMGALMSTTICCTIPLLCYMAHRQPATHSGERVFLLGLLALAVLITLTGTIASVQDALSMKRGPAVPAV